MFCCKFEMAEKIKGISASWCDEHHTDPEIYQKQQNFVQWQIFTHFSNTNFAVINSYL